MALDFQLDANFIKTKLFPYGTGVWFCGEGVGENGSSRCEHPVPGEVFDAKIRQVDSFNSQPSMALAARRPSAIAHTTKL